MSGEFCVSVRKMYSELARVALGAMIMTAIFVFVFGGLFSWGDDLSYWEGVRQALSMVLAICGFFLVLAGFSVMNRATEAWEWVDNDIGSIPRSGVSRLFDLFQGLNFLAVSTVLFSIFFYLN